MSVVHGGFGGLVIGGPQQGEPRAGIHFHLMHAIEQQEVMQGITPVYRNFDCGHCGRSTSGRTLCTLTDENNTELVVWCVCSCDKQLPTVVASNKQFPEFCEFRPGDDWPDDLTKLFDEAAKSFSGAAYTASAMVCRKMLMVCACHEKAKEDLNFYEYVDYITNNVLTFPPAKDSIDAIKKIGNEANHEVKFVSREDAKRALIIVSYLLNTVYSLPHA